MDGSKRAGGGAAAPAARAAVGRAAERIAERWLCAQGYAILARNVRAGGGELDLVAREGGVIVFVEVRSRRRGGRVSPAETLRAGKQRRLIEAAEAWLGEQGLGNACCRFDLVAVERSAAGYRLSLVRDAFVDEDDD
jgi:putative endonuclease